MVGTRAGYIKSRIREEFASEEFQRMAGDLPTAELSEAILKLFRKRAIEVSLVAVRPADAASLADYAVIWQLPGIHEPETNWLTLTRRSSRGRATKLGSLKVA